MTSSGYTADPRAIAAAGKVFEGEAGPIGDQARALDGIKGSSATAGRAYGSSGSAYHDAITHTMAKLISEFSAKTSWMSGALDQSAAGYEDSDSGNSSNIQAAGSAVN